MATTVYGRNLDALMQNRLAQEAADLQKSAQWSDWSSRMGDRGVRLRDVESLDRYRQGDIGARQYQAETGRMDVNEMSNYRKGLNQNAAEQIAAAERAANAANAANLEGIRTRVEGDKYNTQFRVFQPSILEESQAALNNANAALIKAGGLMSPDMKMLAATDAAGRSIAKSQLPILTSAVDAETARILGGKGWLNDDPEYDEIQKIAATMPGGETPNNIKKAARKKAASMVIGNSKTYNIDPQNLSIDDDGNLIVPGSPYATLLGRVANPPDAPESVKPSQPIPEDFGGTNNVPSFNKTQLGTRFRIVPNQR